MSIITKTTVSGANVISSLKGNLAINEDLGEIVIKDGTREVVRIDRNGFQYYDSNSIERIKVGQNLSGQQQIIIKDENGKASILVGQNPKNGKPIIAVTKENLDVIQELLS